MSDPALPAALAEAVADLRDAPEADRLAVLVEFGDELPGLPDRLAQAPDLLEAVPECQSPIFVRVESGDGPEAAVRLFFSAPPAAPTTRGFAGLLHEGLDGATARDVLAVPADLHTRLGLAGLVSPLRLAGMAGMLGRIQRQTREKAGI